MSGSNNPINEHHNSMMQATDETRFRNRKEVRHAIQICIARIYRRAPPSRELCEANNMSLKRIIIRQSFVIDDILYKRAATLDEYLDMETLVDRLISAGGVLVSSLRQRQRELRARHQALVNGFNRDRL